jgi:uncharacterized protein YbjT (DUF2867 family)
VRVLIAGTTGFIGSALACHLAAAGNQVVLVSCTQHPKTARHFAIDMARASTADWSAALEDFDAVVNCAGVFHFAACEQRDVRRIIHLFAAGIGQETPSEFSRTKAGGEAALKPHDLDWVILRPPGALGQIEHRPTDKSPRNQSKMTLPDTARSFIATSKVQWR